MEHVKTQQNKKDRSHSHICVPTPPTPSLHTPLVPHFAQQLTYFSRAEHSPFIFYPCECHCCLKKEKEKEKEREKKRKFSDLKKRSSGKGSKDKSRDGDASSSSPLFDHEAEMQYMQSLVDSEGLVLESNKSKSDTDFDKYNLYDNNNNRGSMINYSKLAFDNNPPSSSDEEEDDNRFSDRNQFNDRENVEDRKKYSGSGSGGDGASRSHASLNESIASGVGTGRPHSTITSTSTNTASSSSSSRPASAAIPPAASNQSMAALLRARLQKGEKLVSAPVAAAPAPAPAANNFSGDRYGQGSSRGTPSNNNNHGNNNNNNRSTQRNAHHDVQQEDIDIASFMSVGELKWMSAFKLKEKEGTNGSSSSDLPSLPVPGEKDCSLQDLVAMEKSGGGLTGSAGDIDKIFAQNIIKRGSGYRGSELGLGSGMGASRGRCLLYECLVCVVCVSLLRRMSE